MFRNCISAAAALGIGVTFFGLTASTTTHANTIIFYGYANSQSAGAPDVLKGVKLAAQTKKKKKKKRKTIIRRGSYDTH